MFKRSQNPKYRDHRDLPQRRLDAPFIIVPNYAKTSSRLHLNYKGATAWHGSLVELHRIRPMIGLRVCRKIDVEPPKVALR